MVRKRQLLDIAFAEFDDRIELPRQLNHPWRQIDANRARAATCRCPGKSTWPSRHVQETDAGAQAHRFEKRQR